MASSEGKRETWTGRFDFALSIVGYAVGLGNIWRFPYLCYRNGGAVFLIPYLIMLMLITLPVLVLEFSLGQFTSSSSTTMWTICPIFKGVGFGTMMVAGITSIYYNTIIAWTLFYLGSSFSNKLPWATCGNWWNTEHCVLHSRDNNESEAFNETYATTPMTYTMNTSLQPNTTSVNSSYYRTSASEEYWQRRVLQLTSGIEEMGGMRWELLGCLALAWFAVFLCLIKGIKSSGKVVYITATLPYLLLISMLVRGVTLPGSFDGVRYYIIPAWHKLSSVQIWGEAAMQIFYSSGVCWGTMLTMASYNKFHHNCYRDGIVLPLLNSGASILAGFVIFSVIGFMAYETERGIDEVVTQGPGLVFVVYPAAVAKMPHSQLWSVLFFVMLLSVGLDSQFGMVEVLVSGIVDELPDVFSTKCRKISLRTVLCVAGFLLGIPCVMNGGIYVLQIMDWYCSVFTIMIICIVEVVVIAWVYGVERFYRDITLMIGYRPCLWWKLCWCFITPCLALFLFIFSSVMLKPVTYGNYTYPHWAISFGWLLATCSMIPLPVVALVKVCEAKGTLLERIKKQMQPTPAYGPRMFDDRLLYNVSLGTYPPCCGTGYDSNTVFMAEEGLPAYKLGTKK